MLKFAPAAIAAFALIMPAAPARADNRVVDGLLGAGAGVLVAGPIGLVAGGVIGYSAGPHISCALREGCHRHPRYRRHYEP